MLSRRGCWPKWSILHGRRTSSAMLFRRTNIVPCDLFTPVHANKSDGSEHSDHVLLRVTANIWTLSDCAEEIMYRVFQRNSPLKLFGIFSLRLSLFTWNFEHLSAIHIHIGPTSTNFCRFILIFHQMALNFARVFTLSSFEYSPWKWKCSVLAFRKWRHFSSLRVLLSTLF